MRRAALLFFVTCFVFLYTFSPPHIFALDTIPEPQQFEAKIIRIERETYRIPPGGTQKIRSQVVLVQSKKDGVVYSIDTGVLPLTSVPLYTVNDEVVVQVTFNQDGSEQAIITDVVRRKPLLLLFLLFCIVAVGIGGVQGLTSLVGMAISFGVIFIFILPQLIQGKDPVTIAIIGSACIVPVTFFLSHGANKKTWVAIVGTMVSLCVTGMLAQLFMKLSSLTGMSSEEAGFLSAYFPDSLNMRGLLLAGIILGGLGIFDDITISQASIVAELRAAGQKSFQALYARAMRVGHDHIASMINTLMLVYTSASLPLLMIFLGSSKPFMEVINYEFIAEEIVRTLVGSIGLMIAVPITTLVAAYVYAREEKKKKNV